MKTFTSHSSTRRFRPSLDLLEARAVPAITIVPDGATLNITSDRAGDRVQIVDNGDGDLRIWVNGVEQSPHFDISRLVIRMGDGNDRVEYTQHGNRSRSLGLDVELQDGRRDVFDANLIGDILAGSVLAMHVRGGNGVDNISVRAVGDVDVQAGATLRLNLQGGDGTDTIFASFNGELDGELQLKAKGNDGVDEVTAYVSAQSGSSGSLRGGPKRSDRHARVEGNGGNDELDFRIWMMSRDTLDVNAILDGGDGSADSGIFTENVETRRLEWLIAL